MSELSELEKQQEEQLKVKVIEYLNIISEELNKGISQALMVSPSDYHSAYLLCKNGLELWTKALKTLIKLIEIKGSE